jgi:uncharacterized membrane protein YccC
MAPYARAVSAAVIISGSTLLVNLLHPFPWVFYPLLTLLVFLLSMISVYGQRANVFRFSGLLAIALGTGHIHTGTDIFMYSTLLFTGSLVYMVLSLTFNYLNPPIHRTTNCRLPETYGEIYETSRRLMGCRR